MTFLSELRKWREQSRVPMWLTTTHCTGLSVGERVEVNGNQYVVAEVVGVLGGWMGGSYRIRPTAWQWVRDAWAAVRAAWRKE